MTAVTLAALAAMVAGCGGPERAPVGGAMLRYASPYPPSHPFSRADIAWIKEVGRRSGGRLRIEPFWGGTLVSSDEATLELAHGVADLALVTPIYQRAGVRAIKTQAGFYAGAETPAEQVAVYACLRRRFPVLDGEMAGVRVLAVQGGNLLNVLTRRRPIARLEDFHGLRLRAPAELATVLRRLGADPVTMPMAEVYAALSKGVIDGVVAPADTLKSLHFNEVAPLLNQWVIPRGAYPARAISARAWRRLSPDLQGVLAGAEPFWEAQLNASVENAEAGGLAFGRAHGQRFIPVAPSEQQRFIDLYNQAALDDARRNAGQGFDAPAMFAAAHAAIADIRAGHPAC